MARAREKEIYLICNKLKGEESGNESSAIDMIHYHNFDFCFYIIIGEHC